MQRITVLISKNLIFPSDNSIFENTWKFVVCFTRDSDIHIIIPWNKAVVFDRTKYTTTAEEKIYIILFTDFFKLFYSI
ncbi:Uncharacterised protein [Streptococcus pneumoniae]|nr:Uncharacterised protein [Streptococcus pneumoniae]CFQ21026.1 Uncharacterised protein [Streptococcus pneumoniae]CIW18912.1 Uncharacterised protein [Streptococcus pneumoniae]CJG83013.1 Uncharacterised protein [Streptococcus pneumoniae]CMU03314.1 Uncharacterised protein [Streptococcus pneumoniae]